MKSDAFARLHESVHRNKDRKAVAFHLEEIRCYSVRILKEVILSGWASISKHSF